MNYERSICTGSFGRCTCKRTSIELPAPRVYTELNDVPVVRDQDSAAPLRTDARHRTTQRGSPTPRRGVTAGCGGCWHAAYTDDGERRRSFYTNCTFLDFLVDLRCIYYVFIASTSDRWMMSVWSASTSNAAVSSTVKSSSPSSVRASSATRSTQSLYVPRPAIVPVFDRMLLSVRDSYACTSLVRPPEATRRRPGRRHRNDDRSVDIFFIIFFIWSHNVWRRRTYLQHRNECADRRLTSRRRHRFPPPFNSPECFRILSMATKLHSA